MTEEAEKMQLIYTNDSYKSLGKKLVKEREINKIWDDTTRTLQEKYDLWTERIDEIMKQCGKKKRKVKHKSKELRKLAQLHRKLKIEKKNREDLTNYERQQIDKQRTKIKEQMHEEEQMLNERRIHKIVSEIRGEGGLLNASAFWEAKKRIQRRKEVTSTAIENKDGVREFTCTGIKEVYKNFYKTLLEGKKTTSDEEKEHEKRVNEKFKRINDIATLQEPLEVTREEIREVIKDLKRGKAGDEYKWKNELIIYGGEVVQEGLMKMFNEINKTENIPTQWEGMVIKSIHKKGSTTKMENRRGLFLTNVISKVYERVMIKKIEKDISLDIHQNGGQKGKGAIDNWMALMAIRDNNIRHNKDTNIYFADAYKCFDRLWLKDCLIDLNIAGVREKEIKMIYNLNRRAVITVETPVGRTTKFTAKEIVKQGTVFGPLLCCASTQRVIDIGEKAKTMVGPDIGIEALVYVDDIAGAGSKNVIEGIIRNTAKMEVEKKFTFNTDKTKYISMTKKRRTEEEINEQIEQGKVERTKDYKYLGNWIGEDGTAERQIQEMENKGEVISKEITRISYNNMGTMRVQTSLLLYKNAGMASLFYNMEMWTRLRKKDEQRMESIQGKILKRIIGLPATTSYWGVLIELGIWPIQQLLQYKKLMVFHQLENAENERLGKKILEEQKRRSIEESWYGEVKEAANSLGILLEEVKGKKQGMWRKEIQRKINTYVQGKASEEIRDKKKLRLLKEFGEKAYIRKMEAIEVEYVLRIKLNMFNVKDNYGKDGNCRLCGQEKETTEHVIECPKIPKEWKDIKREDLESENEEILRKVVKYYKRVEEMIELEEES